MQRRFPRAGFRPELCQNRKNPLRFLSVDGLLLASASPDRRQRIPNLPEGVHHLAMLRCRVSLGAVLGINPTFRALPLGAGNGPGAGPCGHLLAATVLNSPRAVAMSLYIIRAFIKMREDLAANAAILKRLAEIDKTLLLHDGALRDIYQKLRPLLEPPPSPPKPEIGFHVKEDALPYRTKRHRPPTTGH